MRKPDFKKDADGNETNETTEEYQKREARRARALDLVKRAELNLFFAGREVFRCVGADSYDLMALEDVITRLEQMISTWETGNKNFETQMRFRLYDALDEAATVVNGDDPHAQARRFMQVFSPPSDVRPTIEQIHAALKIWCTPKSNKGRLAALLPAFGLLIIAPQSVANDLTKR